MLGGDDHGSDTTRFSIHIFHRDLRLRVRSQPSVFAALAKIGDGTAQLVGIGDRRWHQLGSFPDRVTEHDALVAGTLLRSALVGSGCSVHSLSDVRGLLAERVEEEKRIGIKFAVGVGVADLHHGGLDDLPVVEARTGRDLTTEHHDVVFYHCLTGNARGGVLLKTRIHDGVGDGVTHFIRVPFGHGFGGKNIGVCHVVFTNLDSLIE